MPWWLLAAVGLLVVVLVVLASVQQHPLAVLAPVALGVAVLAAASALTRFTLFVCVLLVVRPLLDVLKVSSGTGLFEPTSLVSLAFLGLAPVWLVVQRRVQRLPWTPLALVVTGYALVLVLSTAGSQVLARSFPEMLKGLSWVVMFFVVRRLVHGEREARLLGLVVLGSALLPAVAGLAEVVLPGTTVLTEYKDGIDRLRSTFFQSNNYGNYLMLVVLAAAPLALLLRGRARLLALGFTGLMSLLLLLTYTRAALLGVVAGLLAVLVVGRHRRLLAAVGVAGLVVVALPPVTASLQESLRPTTSDPRSSENDSFGWRLQYWGQLLPLAAEQPLTGIGPAVTVTRTLEEKEPHNEYLRALVETGVPGALALLALLGVLAHQAVRTARSGAGTVWRAIGTGTAAVTAGLAVAGAASNIFDSVSYMWYFAVLAALTDRSTAATVAPPDSRTSWT